MIMNKGHSCKRLRQPRREPQMWESCHMKRVKLWPAGWGLPGVNHMPIMGRAKSILKRI